MGVEFLYKRVGEHEAVSVIRAVVEMGVDRWIQLLAILIARIGLVPKKISKTNHSFLKILLKNLEDL